MSIVPYLAPSLVRLRNEVNERWPKRDKASDGWIGDTAHSARVSQHNPDGKGCVHAIDVDTDGIDSNWLVQRAIKHPACWYVIYNRTIWSDTDNWIPKPYQGTDPHTGHVHISIHLNKQAELSAAPWLSSPAKPATTEEDDMALSDEDLDKIASRVWNYQISVDAATHKQYGYGQSKYPALALLRGGDARGRAATAAINALRKVLPSRA